MDAILTDNFKIVGLIAEIIVVLSVFIEITPIKINPITKLLEWFQKKMNKELEEKFNELSDKVNNLEESVNSIQEDASESKAIDCRTRILQFGDEVRRGIHHSEDSFEQILVDIDEYEQYCAEHPAFKNNRTMITQEKIREIYKKCIEENDFI